MRRILSLSFLLLVSLGAAAQGVWGARGASRSFAVRGNVLYAADGRGIVTYDISNLPFLPMLDLDSSGYETRDLALAGTNQLVVASTYGLEWYRTEANGLSGPTALTETVEEVTHVAGGSRYAAAVIGGDRVAVYEAAALVTDYQFAHEVRAIAFVGDVLYVSVDREGTYVYPVPAGDWTTKLLEVPLDFALSGTTLWGASRDTGLTSYDVRVAADPRRLGSIDTYPLDGVAVAGTRVFAFQSPNKVRVFDAANPAKPQLAATLDEWVNVIAASGQYFFLAGAIIDAEGLSSETGKPLRVFDAATLSIVGERADYAGPVSGVWTDGSIAYVVDPPYLRVLDVSTTNLPRELSSILVPDIQDRIRVKNGLAVIYGRAQVNLIDVSSPLAPRHVGNWVTDGHPRSAAAIARDKFVEANEHSGFHIVDYSDPARAVQVGGRKWHYHDIAAGDDAVYLLEHNVLLTVEIENGTTAVDRHKIQILGEQLEISPPGSPAPRHLVARTGQGIHVYSLDDRFAPRQTAFVPLVQPGLLATGDGVVYVDLDGVLHRMDLAAPAAPVSTGMRVTSPQQMSVAGEKIVIADRYFVRVYGPNTAPPPVVPAAPSRRRAVRR